MGGVFSYQKTYLIKKMEKTKTFLFYSPNKIKVLVLALGGGVGGWGPTIMKRLGGPPPTAKAHVR